MYPGKYLKKIQLLGGESAGYTTNIFPQIIGTITLYKPQIAIVKRFIVQPSRLY